MVISINKEIKIISWRYPNYKFFLFGSFLNNGKMYGDIDVLILYETPESIKDIRRDFQNINSYEVFHLLFLNSEEEKEIKFVEKVNAREV